MSDSDKESESYNQCALSPDAVLNLKAEGTTDSPAKTHQAIEKQAYDIYQRDGCKDGNCQENWYQAEQQKSRDNAQWNPASARIVVEKPPSQETGPANCT